jgi:hypothetical protein
MLKFDPQHCFARGGTEGDNILQDGVHWGSSKGAQMCEVSKGAILRSGVKRCHPAVQRAIKWAHPANLSRAIGEAGGATGRKNVGHTTIAATRSTSRSTQAAAEHRSESGSRGVGSDNCERTTPSAIQAGANIDCTTQSRCCATCLRALLMRLTLVCPSSRRSWPLMTSDPRRSDTLWKCVARPTHRFTDAATLLDTELCKKYPLKNWYVGI